jgi:hypothetical protein
MGIPTHIAIGIDLPTPTGARYARDFTPGLCNANPEDCKPDEVFFGNGDGTVNVQSALVTRRLSAWENASYLNVTGVSHLGLVGSDKLINWILGIVLGKNGNTSETGENASA